MVATSRKRRRHNAKPDTSRGKGDLLEQIVADMHKAENVKIDRNIFLPCIDGSSRKREIDVLVTSTTAGFPVRFAIECKNKRAKIGVEDIDGFIGKLKDIGIPTATSAFVSASGFTEGARQRCMSVQMHPFVYTNSTDALLKLVDRALQINVFVSLSVLSVTGRSDIGGHAPASDIFRYFSPDGSQMFNVLDGVYSDWITSKISDKLGDQRYEIELPNGYYQLISGKKSSRVRFEITLAVRAHVAIIPGTIQEHSLLNVSGTAPNKQRIDVQIKAKPGKYSIKNFSDDKELSDYLEQNRARAIAIVVGKLRAPRITWFNFYYPVSKKTQAKLNELQTAYIRGEGKNPVEYSVAEIEGTDLSDMFFKPEP